MVTYSKISDRRRVPAATTGPVSPGAVSSVAAPVAVVRRFRTLTLAGGHCRVITG